MGKITVFSIDNCPFCAAAKKLLRDKGEEYVEINLDGYPGKRSDMLKLTNSFTVPQIFFNDKHIGGANDLQALEESGELDDLIEQVHQNDGPHEKLLQKPNEPPRATPKASPRKEEVFECGRAGTLDLVTVVMQLDKAFKGKSSAKASEIVSSVCERYGLESRSQGVEIASQLASAGALTAVDKKSAFEDNDVWWWISVRANVGVLNNFRAWNDRVDEPVLVVTLLKKRMGKLVSKYRDDNQKVDYLALVEDPDFYALEEAACELQAIDMKAMSLDARKAFVINLYNYAIVHAFAKVGPPKSALQRGKFFTRVGYNVGGEFYSFDALESGVLRANRKGPGLKLSGPIPKNDPRLRNAFPDDQVDCRIHTALSCGASSCPAVKKFSAEAVDEELDLVARGFFSQPENFSLSGRTIHLNMILKWYGRDFGKNQAEVLRTIAQWLPAQQQDTIRHLVETKQFVVKYNFYDWSNDGSRTKNLNLGNNAGGNSCIIA